MTAAAAALLAAAGLAAVVDWWAVATGARRAEYVCKPAAILLLTGVALTLEPADSAQRAWFVAALLLSAAGDVLLMLPDEQFVPGLASFLGAHAAYIVGFLLTGRPGTAGLVVGLLIVLNAFLLAATRIVDALRARGEGALVGPVMAYMAAIGTMTVLATGSGSVAAAIGGVLFLASDTLLAWNRFVGPVPGARLGVIVTYHLGQTGLVLSLVR